MPTNTDGIALHLLNWFCCVAGFLLLGTNPATAEESPPAYLVRLETLVETSRYAEAVALADSLAPALRAAEGPHSTALSDVLQSRLEALYRGGQASDPRSIAQKRELMEIAYSQVDSDSIPMVSPLLHAGNLHIYRREPAVARDYYARALAILDESGDQSSQEYALALSNLGVSLKQTGDLDGAIEAYERGIALREEKLGPDHPSVAESLNNMANLHIALGNYSFAIAAHERALRIRERAFGPDHEWVAESLTNLATVLGYAGDYARALDAQERANQIFDARLGNDHQRTWAGRQNAGILYADMGDHRRSIRIFEAGLAHTESALGSTHPALINGLDALAASLTEVGEFDRAISLYERSLEISEAAYAGDNWAGAYTRQGFGDCLSRAGQDERALSELKTALAYWEASLSPNSPELSDLLHILAEAELRAGHFESALEVARRSVANLESGVGPGHPMIAEALRAEALASWNLGDENAAFDRALRAETISRAHLMITMRVLPESQALDYGESRSQGLDIALGLISELSDTQATGLADARIRSRALVFDEMAARQRSYGSQDSPEIHGLVLQQRTARERFANLTLRGPGWEDPRTYRQLLNDSQHEIDRAERELALASERFREEISEREIGLTAVRAKLRDADALVSYVRYNEVSPRSAHREGTARYAAFVLTGRDEAPQWFDLGAADEIDAATERWRSVAARTGEPRDSRGFVRRPSDPERSRGEYRTAAQQLREKILDPLQPALQGRSRWFVVPDGSLHLVNLYALVDEKGNFLLETGPTIHLLPSERTLCHAHREPSDSTTQVLMVGDPDYGQVDTAAQHRGGDCDSLEELHFAALAGARDEVEELEEISARRDSIAVQVLEGSAATESAFKSAASTHHVLHLATHGFFLSDDCEDEASTAGNRTSPLALSGLAFAGANLRDEHIGEEDGLLTAAEVASLELSAVNWAVLSACDTGLGAILDRSEGVFGLARSFQIAGARSVIMSLWPVDDQATREWMTTLYERRWDQSAPTGEAVRDACRAVLARRRDEGRSEHPYFWAAFVSTGDWR